MQCLQGYWSVRSVLAMNTSNRPKIVSVWSVQLEFLWPSENWYNSYHLVLGCYGSLNMTFEGCRSWIKAQCKVQAAAPVNFLFLKRGCWLELWRLISLLVKNSFLFVFPTPSLQHNSPQPMQYLQMMYSFNKATHSSSSSICNRSHRSCWNFYTAAEPPPVIIYPPTPHSCMFTPLHTHTVPSVLLLE